MRKKHDPCYQSGTAVTSISPLSRYHYQKVVYVLRACIPSYHLIQVIGSPNDFAVVQDRRDGALGRARCIAHMHSHTYMHLNIHAARATPLLSSVPLRWHDVQSSNRF